MKRVFLIVLDSLGIGALPDAAQFGDEGSNTLGAIQASPYFHCPNLTKLGLFRIDGTDHTKQTVSAQGVYARLQEQSMGKDTTTGHWEICGVVSKEPFPTYPEGFPTEVIEPFSAAVGRDVLCNRPYSGTQVIADYGQAHIDTGALIVYTSADSVFQIAAHEDIVPVQTLYRYCEAARAILTGRHRAARVIARPFAGEAPSFYRTGGRKDFSVSPPKATLLNLLEQSGLDVLAVGKISDIFNGSGVTRAYHSHSNQEGMAQTQALLAEPFHGLCFVNLVDFDMLYGHRNDTDGYAKAMSRFDWWLGSFITELQTEDLLMITGDHGCDPSTPSTDHSREATPLLAYAPGIIPCNLGTRASFADIGKTIAEIFHADPANQLEGVHFLEELYHDR